MLSNKTPIGDAEKIIAGISDPIVEPPVTPPEPPAVVPPVVVVPEPVVITPPPVVVPPVVVPPEPPVVPAPAVVPPVAQVVPPLTEGEIDYQARYRGSTQENLILQQKNQKLVETIIKADALPDPTPEELATAYPGYADLTDFEKIMAKKQLISDRRDTLIKSAVEDNRKVDEWVGKVTAFVDNDENKVKHPDLKGNEDEFRIYANKPNHRGVDFEVLVNAFLNIHGPNKKHKGEAIPVGGGSGGTPVAPAKAKMSVSDISAIRTGDPRRYQQMVAKGEINPFSD